MMDWSFERVAGPYGNATEGLAWDGRTLLFSQPEANMIWRYNPADGQVSPFRNYTNYASGLAVSVAGEIYGAQRLSRRLVRYNPDGSTSPMTYRFDGLPFHDSFHNYPKHIVADARDRLWFSDPKMQMLASGPPLPFPNHESVLRLDHMPDRSWVLRRATFDTTAPSGVALSPDGSTLYVSDSSAQGDELRAYPVGAEGTLGAYALLHSFGAGSRSRHRGIDGMCVDADGNLIAAAGSSGSGPGPMIYVFSPTGAVLESHVVPAEAPTNVAFGDASLSSLYVTTTSGHVFRVRNSGHKGHSLGPKV